MKDLEEAATKVKLGPEKKRLQSDLDRKMTAYHEGGHAVVSYFSPNLDIVHRIVDAVVVGVVHVVAALRLFCLRLHVEGVEFSEALYPGVGRAVVVDTVVIYIDLNGTFPMPHGHAAEDIVHQVVAVLVVLAVGRSIGICVARNQRAVVYAPKHARVSSMPCF